MLLPLTLFSILTLLLILYSFAIHREFFPSINNLFTSKISLLILSIEGFFVLYECLRHLSRIFIGRILSEEIEALKDKLMFLAFEFGILMSVHPEGSIFLFAFLSFSNLLHCLFAMKVESLQRMARVSLLVSYRLISMCLLLGIVDSWVLFKFYRKDIIWFETASLMVDLIHASVKALTIVYEIESTHLDLFTHIAKFVIYIMYSFAMYAHPFIMLSLLTRTITYFSKIFSVLRTLAVARNIEQVFDSRQYNVVDEDLSHQDMCLICRETMTSSLAKKLECGHVFHLECIKRWLRQNTSCPTCRREINFLVSHNTPLKEFKYQPIFDDVLESLNEEELKILENDMRRATVARIKSFNNVNSLLNEAAMRISMNKQWDEAGNVREGSEDIKQMRIDAIRRAMGNN